MSKPVKAKEVHPVRWIRVDEIGIVWPEAQRFIEERQVKRIMDEFDPDALGVIQLAEKNGKGLYHPVDGQHRAEALKRMGYGDQLILAEVHDVRSAKEAAKLFDKLNRARKPQALATFQIRLTAQEEQEVEIVKILKSCGFHFGSNPSSREISAVRALTEVFRRGPDVLRNTLLTIAATWRDDEDCTTGVIVQGYGLLIATYGAALEYKRLRERVAKKFTAAGLIAACRQQKTILGMSGPQAVMWVVARCYNQGLKPEAQLPLA